MIKRLPGVYLPKPSLEFTISLDPLTEEECKFMFIKKNLITSERLPGSAKGIYTVHSFQGEKMQKLYGASDIWPKHHKTVLDLSQNLLTLDI